MIQAINVLAQPVGGKLEQERLGTWRETWMTSPADRAIIVTLLRKVQAEDMIEIGVHEGWTAKMVLENVPSIKRYRGVDVPLSYCTGLILQQGEIPPNPGIKAQDDPRFELIIRPRGSLDLDDLSCDAILIDGDHARVREDSELALSCSRKLVMWHDYSLVPTVTNVVDELAERFPIKHAAGTWLAYLIG